MFRGANELLDLGGYLRRPSSPEAFCRLLSTVARALSRWENHIGLPHSRRQRGK